MMDFICRVNMSFIHSSQSKLLCERVATQSPTSNEYTRAELQTHHHNTVALSDTFRILQPVPAGSLINHRTLQDKGDHMAPGCSRW